MLKVNLTLLFRVGCKMNYTEMTGKHLNKYRNEKKERCLLDSAQMETREV